VLASIQANIKRLTPPPLRLTAHAEG
jgi:hypothetical protein